MIKDGPVLTTEEKVTLREGMENSPVDAYGGDQAIALVRAEEILKKWRDKIDVGVEEGNDYNSFAKSCLPADAADTDATKIAAKLIEFKMVDISKVELPAKLTKEEKSRQHTAQIVKSTIIAEPIKVSFMSGPPSDSSTHSSADDSDSSSGHSDSSMTDSDSSTPTTNSSTDSNSTRCWVSGSAIKMTAGKWQVIVSDGSNFEVDEDDLMDESRFFVEHAFQNTTPEQRREEAQKTKKKATTRLR